MLNGTEVHAEGLWEIFVVKDMILRKQKTQVMCWSLGGWVLESRLKYFLSLFIPKRIDCLSALLHPHLNYSQVLLFIMLVQAQVEHCMFLFLFTHSLVGSALPFP